MDLSTGIRNLFENITYYPKFNIQAGHIQKYRIEMNNEYLNEKGDIVKRQKLVSDYTRKITDLPHDFYALTEITIDRVEFSSDKIQKPIRWTFAEGLKLPFYLYICNYLDDYKMIAEECDNGLIKQRNQEFADIFSAFPKLPSVDVFIMLAYDIIGFETLLYTVCLPQNAVGVWDYILKILITKMETFSLRSRGTHYIGKDHAA